MKSRQSRPGFEEARPTAYREESVARRSVKARHFVKTGLGISFTKLPCRYPSLYKLLRQLKPGREADSGGTLRERLPARLPVLTDTCRVPHRAARVGRARTGRAAGLHSLRSAPQPAQS